MTVVRKKIGMFSEELLILLWHVVGFTLWYKESNQQKSTGKKRNWKNIFLYLIHQLKRLKGLTQLILVDLLTPEQQNNQRKQFLSCKIVRTGTQLQ